MQRIIELLVDNYAKTTGQSPVFSDGKSTFQLMEDNLFDGQTSVTLLSKDIEQASFKKIESREALLLNLFSGIQPSQPLAVYLHNNKREKKLFDKTNFFVPFSTLEQEKEVMDLVLENDQYQLFVTTDYFEPFLRAKHVIQVNEAQYKKYTASDTTSYPNPLLKENFSRFFRILIAMLHSDEFHYFDVLHIAKILLAIMIHRNPIKKTNLLILHWVPTNRYSDYFSSLQKDVLSRYPLENLRVGQIFQNFVMYSLNLKAPQFEIYFFNYQYFFSLTDYAKVFPERYDYVQKRYFQ